MDDFLIKIYLEQAEQECERCFNSIKIMNAIMQKKIDGDFFQYALDLIHHAAAISRIFGLQEEEIKRVKSEHKEEVSFLETYLSCKAGMPYKIEH
tara:strand:- start:784 stop:1068 length:285 start_codon:yes stop_codon:yes gene_type:complete